MKTGCVLTYTLWVFWHQGGVNSFADWASFEANFQVEFFPLNDQYGQGKCTLDEHIDSFWALVEQARYPNSFQFCLTFQDDLHPTLINRIDNLVEG